MHGGLYGTAPNLNPFSGNPTLENNGGDVTHETDFRSVYARGHRQLARRELDVNSPGRLPQTVADVHLTVTDHDVALDAGRARRGWWHFAARRASNRCGYFAKVSADGYFSCATQSSRRLAFNLVKTIWSLRETS